MVEWRDKPYEITVRVVGGSTVVAMSGELDITAEADLEHAFAEARRHGASVVVDLRETQFFDASTVDVLFREHLAGTTLAAEGAHGEPRRVLEIVDAPVWMDVAD